MNITNEELLKLKEAILMVNDMFNDVCGEWSVDEMRKLDEALEIIESKTTYASEILEDHGLAEVSRR